MSSPILVWRRHNDRTAIPPPPRGGDGEGGAGGGILGLAGDITTNALIPADAVCEATLGLREDGRIAGLPLAVAAFRALDPEMAVEARVEEGAMPAPEPRLRGSLARRGRSFRPSAWR